jgi:hypothetical protein
MASIGWRTSEVKDRMLEICIGLICLIPFLAAAMFVGILLQGILDAMEDRKKNRKKKKKAKAAQEQLTEETVYLFTWRSDDG